LAEDLAAARRPRAHPLALRSADYPAQTAATFFGYNHVFEAYVPKPKRKFGYFALPVLIGDKIVAVVDLKTDRAQQKLLVQQWTWIEKGSKRARKKQIEEALHRFEQFQLAR
jgi:uncharacterized protein YcaQ